MCRHPPHPNLATTHADSTRAFWDQQAARYDKEPDHGLTDPAVRAAWQQLLLPLLPEPRARIADLGCGTGTLAVLMAAEGHQVSGVDQSERMLAEARSKAASAGVEVDLSLGDAADPPLGDGTYDVALVRHVLWALPNPLAALARWCRLLAPGGRLILVEGWWHTGGGLHADHVQAMVLECRSEAVVTPLPDPQLWGGPTTDERYLVLSRR